MVLRPGAPASASTAVQAWVGVIKFLDGPAAGAPLPLRRAPMYLRVVIDPSGKVDALDQLDDEPRAGETVHVYARARWAGPIHVCGGLNGNRSRVHGSGWVIEADYRHMPDVDGEGLRDTETWRAWATAQPDLDRAIT